VLSGLGAAQFQYSLAFREEERVCRATRQELHAGVSLPAIRLEVQRQFTVGFFQARPCSRV
jgi:hypothetical protein